MCHCGQQRLRRGEAHPQEVVHAGVCDLHSSCRRLAGHKLGLHKLVCEEGLPIEEVQGCNTGLRLGLRPRGARLRRRPCRRLHCRLRHRNLRRPRRRRDNVCAIMLLRHYAAGMREALVLPSRKLHALLLGGLGSRLRGTVPALRIRVANLPHALELVLAPQVRARALDLRYVRAHCSVHIRTAHAEEDAEVHTGPRRALVAALRTTGVGGLLAQPLEDLVVFAVEALDLLHRVLRAELAGP
mmetsp:Transcript_53392/g.138094  ORF Transcript_53392/g.138094 Transcript_53392/m.138094 type:complete len:242 (+) Transcript_53392:307-1032(+)